MVIGRKGPIPLRRPCNSARWRPHTPLGEAVGPTQGAHHGAMDFFNQEPVVHTWTYKLDKAA
jgi:hypothetical protein